MSLPVIRVMRMVTRYRVVIVILCRLTVLVFTILFVLIALYVVL